MTYDDLIPLIKTTLKDPATAARTIIGWQLPREALWMALALVAALNTMVLQLMLSGANNTALIPNYFFSPLTLFVLMIGLLVVFIHTLYWAGLSIKGQGRLDDLLAVMVWLQILRTIAQVCIIVVSLLVPSLGMIAMLIASAWGLWILLNFIATALNLPSVGHGLIVLVIGLVGLVLGVSFLLALVGVGAQGTTPHV